MPCITGTTLQTVIKSNEYLGGKLVYVLDKDSRNFPSSLSPPPAPKVMPIACREESRKICIRAKRNKKFRRKCILELCCNPGQIMGKQSGCALITNQTGEAVVLRW